MEIKKKKFKILFLEAAAGGGHISITTAIVQSLLRKYPQVEIIREDILPALLQNFYRLANRQFMDAYSFFYKATDKQKGSDFLSKIDMMLYRKKITKLIQTTKPDLIFSNVYFAANEVPFALDQLSYKVPFLVFVSDPFSPFSGFFSEHADLTLVSTLASYQLGLGYGLDSKNLMITGHPVREEFFQSPKDIAVHRISLGLKPKVFTILFGGSGHGSDRTLEVLLHLGIPPSQKLLGKILKLTALEYKTFYKLVSQDFSEKNTFLPELQILCVTGDNSNLKDTIEQLKFPKNVTARVYGKVDDMASLVHSADLVVGKAGPNAIFESIAALKPFLVTNHMKGQETENLDFVRYAQVGFVEEDPRKASEFIKLAILNKEILHGTLKPISFIRSQHMGASERIAESIITTMERSGGF